MAAAAAPSVPKGNAIKRLQCVFEENMQHDIRQQVINADQLLVQLGAPAFVKALNHRMFGPLFWNFWNENRGNGCYNSSTGKIIFQSAYVVLLLDELLRTCGETSSKKSVCDAENYFIKDAPMLKMLHTADFLEEFSNRRKRQKTVKAAIVQSIFITCRKYALKEQALILIKKTADGAKKNNWCTIYTLLCGTMPFLMLYLFCEVINYYY